MIKNTRIVVSIIKSNTQMQRITYVVRQMRYEGKTGTVPQFGENRSNREYTHKNWDYEKISN
jgi:hypothetical protein